MADDLVERLTKLAQVIEGWPPTVWTETVIDIRAAVAEIERLRAAQQGQPIETAPKDRAILVGGGTYEWDSDYADRQTPFPGIALVCWNETRGAWQGEGDNSGHDSFYWHKPTVWWPLPTPPEEGT